MPAPTYDDIKCTLASGLVKASAKLVTSFEKLPNPNGTFVLPTLPGATLSLGTGAGQFNVISKLYTATAAGITNYDLLSLVDWQATALTVDAAVGVVVANFSTTAGYILKIGAAGTNPWVAPFDGSITAKVTLRPGFLNANGSVSPSYFFLSAADATGLITSSTSKVLAVDAGANTVKHAFFVVGRDV